MDNLKKEIDSLLKSELNQEVDKRLEDFSTFKIKPKKEWFEELCFCILAANAKGRNAFNIQLDLGYSGLMKKSKEQLVKTILKHKHRFHNNKANYIIESRKHNDIKDKTLFRLQNEGISRTREWLVKNVKGLGFKEASHFLRNTGVTKIAILDRHILNVLNEHKIIEKPNSLTPKLYLEIEKKFFLLSKNFKLSPAKLDLFMWYMKTGEVMK